VPAPWRGAHQARSVAFNVISGTPASAFETGQPILAPSAAATKASSSIPGTVAKDPIFADGFAGAQAPRNPRQATWRVDVDGVAPPDGRLYIAESAKGRIWRVVYKGAGGG